MNLIYISHVQSVELHLVVNVRSSPSIKLRTFIFTLTVSLDSTASHIVGFDLLIILIYILYIFRKKRGLAGEIKAISEFISEYFLNTGAEVEVSCFKLDLDKRYVVLIQSEPLKRFRYSNILESNLTSHVFKKTGNTIEKIFWRFPVQIKKDLVGQESDGFPDPDDIYFSNIQLATANNEKYKVSDSSWDEFKSSK